jgi:hypothetical protein
MSSKSPPLREAFFDFEAEVAGQNPNLPGAQAQIKFLRTSRPWAEWCARIAQAIGFPLESLTKTASLNFPLIAANGGTQDLTVTVTGVKAADVSPVVNLGLPSALAAGLVFHGFVSADDTVTVRATNATAGGIDPAAFTCRVEVRRY